MLEKPNLPDQQIIDRMQAEYALRVNEIIFLPLGADVNTAVYRVTGEAGEVYFLKLRKGEFNPVTVTLPIFLHAARRLQSIIAPRPTAQDDRPWGSLGEYSLILYPFVEGQNGYEATLTAQQWQDFGAAMRVIHTTPLPPALSQLIPRETFSPYFRDRVQAFQAQAEAGQFTDPVAAKLAAFMRSHREDIWRMLKRAGQLAQAMQANPPEFVLCHADIHAGNLLIGADGALYIVDWDNTCFAPKERDLLLVGGCSTWNDPNGEKQFYLGYQGAVDSTALAYYRYMRELEDIAAFCEQLFLSNAGGQDREQSYQYFTGAFLPGHEVDIAFRTDAALN